MNYRDFVLGGRTLLATITSPAGDSRMITKSPGASAPACLQFSNYMCGYWETRFELFLWACGMSGFNPVETTFEDGSTGELLDYFELLDEAYDEYAA